MVTFEKDSLIRSVSIKLIKSLTFKNIFNNVFGESTSGFNVKFKIVDNLTLNGNSTNGVATRHNYTLDSEGTLVNMNITIKLNSNLFVNKSTIEIAKTIIHECIHAYLYVKIIDCNQGANLTNISESLFEELMNQYFPSDSCNQPQSQ